MTPDQRPVQGNQPSDPSHPSPAALAGEGPGAGGRTAPPFPYSPTPPLAWTVWLARRQPGRAAAVIAVVGAAAAAGFWVGGSLLLSLLAVAVLVGAVGEFLLPVRYRLSEAGAEARSPVFWRRIDWAQVKRVYLGEEEIKLSPLPHGGRNEAFRGVLLRCDGNRDAVLAAIRSFRDAVPRD